MRVIIVGGGQVVYYLARTFLSKGYNVSIINESHQECIKLTRRLKALIINGDGSSSRYLNDAKANEAKLLIAVTPYDHINLVCCQTASLKFNIPKTLALVNDPDNYNIYKELGINYVFNQTDLMVSMIEKQVQYDYITNLLEYDKAGILINEVSVSSKMPSAGKTLGELGLPDGSAVFGVTRRGRFYLNDKTFRLQPDDSMLLMTTPGNHGAVLKLLCGEEA